MIHDGKSERRVEKFSKINSFLPKPDKNSLALSI